MCSLAPTFTPAPTPAGIRSCDKEDGENRLYHLKRSSTSCNSSLDSESCTSATVCRDAALDDPCDAPERCYGSTSPECFSSRGDYNDSRYTLNVAGLPTHGDDNEPIYANWLTGGKTTGFVTNLDSVLAGNQVSRSWSDASMDWVTVTEAAGSYATRNPASVSGVTARCNGTTVDFRVKWYCALSIPAPHIRQYPLATPPHAAAEQSRCLPVLVGGPWATHVSFCAPRQLRSPTSSTSIAAQNSLRDRQPPLFT